ncbi:MAG: hypothetical protein FJ291_14305 [Planctomycetes bacterium]|nr:hypothetical protein [Planctomycetota bacterium]
MVTVMRAVALSFLLASAALADSFTIRCDWFDRGNVDTERVARPYSDKYPCIVNGGVVPNQAEYDIEFPAAGDYTISGLYAAASSRPVDILLDGKVLARGFRSVTGGWMTSGARWEKQCSATISQGKHTLKLLCAVECMPHICALRFETDAAFPKDWRLARRVPKSPAARPQPQKGTLADREGFLGFYPYNPPDAYDYLQPYDPIPLPNPRAHRVLEYVLLGKEVKAEIIGKDAPPSAGPARPGAEDPARNELLQASPLPSDVATDWVANLTVAVDAKREERDTLPLSPPYLRKMLEHTARLIGDFRAMPAKPGDFLASERDEAAKLLAALDKLVPAPEAAPSPQPSPQGRGSEAAPSPQPSPQGRGSGAAPSPRPLPEGEGEKAKWERFYALYLQAFRLKHRVALSNPLIDFDKLVVAKRLTTNTSHIYTIYYDGSDRYKAGSGIFVLSPVRPDGRLTCLTGELKPDGIYRDPDVSWDGSRVLFSYKADRPTATLIYEVGTDGTGLRQLTKGLYDDVDPCYLPDGRIAFISTRTERVTLCHNAFTVSNLHTMNADGSDIRCISTNTIHDFTPSVLHDGQLAVSQWRYVDRHVGNNQSLWRCNPDGTRTVHVSGEHFGPVTFWGARAVPGSQLIACILGPHMPYAVGPVAIVDPAYTHSSPAVFTNLTPEVPPPSHATYQRKEAGFYADVFPLSESYFLVSYCYGPDQQHPTGYGIYLLDKWNNRDLIYRDPELSTFEAFPLKPRPRPGLVAPREQGVAAVPSHNDPAKSEWGTFFCLNVYEGLTGVQPGEVKWLRVLEEVPKPVSSHTQGYGLQNPAISFSGQFALKRLWGVVPVEADGSIHFKAPANRMLYFSALDANMMEVQRMRTFTTVAPGETYGCIGCHERKTNSPPTAFPTALHRPPSEIAPPKWAGIHGPDFYKTAQPVLDKHCVKCHSGPQPKGGVDLSPDFTPIFNVAYETLCSKRLVSYVDLHHVSTLITRPPKYYGSHASKMMKAVLTTHKDRVSLSQEDLERLATWIDSNAPYYGTYVYDRPGTTGGRDIFAKGKGVLDDVHKRRCASCHGTAATATVLRMRLPAESTRALLAPLAKAAGGDDTCRAGTALGGLGPGSARGAAKGAAKADELTGQPLPVFASKADPDYQKLLAVYADIAANPRVDMLPERPPLSDPACRYVYRPGVVRDAPR